MQGTNWVKCSDSLPNMDTPVFAGWFRENGEFVFGRFVRCEEHGDEGWIWLWSICTGDYLSDEGDWLLDDDYSMITHWMPLPLPPMPEGEWW
ncbi:DUF551 domain-containing protein [Providencia rettgeri]|nr:DUF551 domain-containing protein [Providencia rettgeri]